MDGKGWEKGERKVEGIMTEGRLKWEGGERRNERWRVDRPERKGV